MRPWGGARGAVAASASLSTAFVVRALGRTTDGGYLATLFDDAMISMTYARNLADGHGLVWNAGQPAVEGYSNTLWTLVMAATHLLPLPDRLAALPVSAIAAGLLAVTVVLVHRLAAELAPDRPVVATAAAWATAVLYPLSYWSLRGMEVGPVAALTTAAALLALRLTRRWQTTEARWLALALAALVLVRDDTAVLAAVVLVGLWWLGRGRVPVASVVRVAVPAVAAVVAHEVFRAAYYGDLLPNTYYLKVEGVSLGTRLHRGLLAVARPETLPVVALLVLGALGAVRAAGAGQGDDRRRWLPVALGAAGIAYSVLVGGDAWEWMPYPNRYITSVLPVVLAAAAVGVDELVRADRAGRPRRGHRLAPGIPLAALVVLAALPWAHWVATAGAHVDDDAFWARRGMAVRDRTPAGTTVAVAIAGNQPYFAHRPSIDLLGKSDPVIARGRQVEEFLPGHSKRDLGHSIGELRPDLVLELWHATADEVVEMQAWGYERVGEVWYRPDRLDRDAVAAIAATPTGRRPGRHR